MRPICIWTSIASKLSQFSLTQRDVANSISTSLSSSRAVHPNFWLDPKMASLTWSQRKPLSTQVIVYSG